MDHTFSTISRNSFLNLKTQRVLLDFLEDFIVLHFILRPLIHSSQFLYGLRWSQGSFLLHIHIQLLQQHLLKRLSFLHYVYLYQKSTVYICVALILDCQLSSIDLRFFLSIPQCLDYNSLIVCLEIRYVNPLI